MFVNSSVSEVLYAASWICGEFAEYDVFLYPIISNFIYLLILQLFAQ